jgi:hypothetical protein
VLIGGTGGGPGAILVGPLHTTDGAWAADPYPLFGVGVEFLHEVLWVARFVVLFASPGRVGARELEGGALYYFAVF